jgi:tetratricopeptide (TPR) repeat protein
MLPHDLDLSAFLIGEDNRARADDGIVFYNRLQSTGAAVEHGGDNRSGLYPGDDEIIWIELDGLPDDVASVAFAVTSGDASPYFGEISNAYLRILDGDTLCPIAILALSEDYAPERGLLAGEVHREGSGWAVRLFRVPQPCTGLDELCNLFGLPFDSGEPFDAFEFGLVEAGATSKTEAERIDALVDEAERHREAGRYDQAVAACTAALGLDPGHVRGRLARGIAHNLAKDLDASLADLDEVLRRDPDLTAALHWRGHTHLERSDFRGAIRDFTQVLQRERSGMAFANRALAYRNAGELAEALEDFEASVRIEPTPLRWFGRGTTLAELGDYEGAVESLTQALSLDPGRAEIYARRAEVLHDLGRHREALNDYARALEERPDPNLLFRSALCWSALDAPAKAGAALTEALQLDSNAVLHVHRARTWTEQGQAEAAIADYTDALALDPSLAHALRERAACHEELGDYLDAVRDHEAAIRLEPDFMQGYRTLAHVHFRNGRNRKALATYAEAIAHAPDQAMSYAGRALVHESDGAADLALADYEAALRLEPGNAMVLFNRGDLHEMQGRLTEAIADFEAALTADPAMEAARRRLDTLRQR